MQQIKGSWTKVAAVTTLLSVSLGVGYAFVSQLWHNTGYYFEWNSLEKRVPRAEISPYRRAFSGPLPFDAKRFFGKSNTHGR